MPIETEVQTPSQVKNIYERMDMQNQMSNIESDIIVPLKNIEQTIIENVVEQVDNKDIKNIANEQNNFKTNAYKKLNELNKKVDKVIKEQSVQAKKLDKILKLLESNNGKK
jgi:cellulose synthase/poly-beta-1,6-N-acetylglucosamine synthase-like glycosyltransferase